MAATSQPVSTGRIGRYEIIGPLAAGGMAEVLLARLCGPHGFEKPVVIKRILRAYLDAPGFWEMFVDEARIVATIHHPAVVQVYELGVDEGELFLVMEYLQGRSVSAVLRRLWEQGRFMDPVSASLVAAGACAGLHAAHELTDAEGRPRRVVHRDVSPQNLFLTYDGHVKVLDFGIALVEGRSTRTEVGFVKGKRAYMSPEQCMGRPLDRRSDLFSLGVVLYELCSTARLFDRAEPHLVQRAICEDPIPTLRQTRPDAPEALERIVSRALARRPDDRYATAQEMRRDLLAFVRDAADAEPEERLTRLMQDLFPADGRDLRNRAQVDETSDDAAGPQAVTRMERTGAATDATTLGAVSRTDPAMAPVVNRRKDIAPRRRGTPSRRKTLAAAAGLLVLASGGLYMARRWHDRPDPGAATSAAPSIPPAPLPFPTAPASSGPKQVTVGIDTSPAGARVLVAGEERGLTPLRLALPATGELVPVALILDRYEPYRLDVRSDVDQRLVLTLQRAGVAQSAPPASSPASWPAARQAPRAMTRYGPAEAAPVASAPVAAPASAPASPPSASNSSPGFIRFPDPVVGAVGRP
jgi:serine/threonine-protein kinase